MSDKAYLSIIVPAYNEAGRIGPSLETLEAFVKKQTYPADVFIVNDCSLDGTREVVETFIKGKPQFNLVNNITNMGKGAAVQKGMMMAKGQFRLFADADMSTSLEEVDKFLLAADPPPGSSEQKYDVVIGSRRVEGSLIALRQPFFREMAGRFFSLMVRALALRGYLDTQCGFKLFSAEAADEVFQRQTIQRFGFDVEILYIAQKLGYKILEAPVIWKDSPASTVRLHRDSVDMFLDLFKIRKNDFLGAYK
jgi:dolichyl-phosphate beta-glucosyltransferase